MKDLFYSHKEKILFFVDGYNCSNRVDDIVKTLTKNADKLAGVISVGRENVKTFFVDESRRYKSMRVFYVETSVIPQDAFELGEEWTMTKWIAF